MDQDDLIECTGGPLDGRWMRWTYTTVRHEIIVGGRVKVDGFYRYDEDYNRYYWESIHLTDKEDTHS